QIFLELQSILEFDGRLRVVLLRQQLHPALIIAVRTLDRRTAARNDENGEKQKCAAQIGEFGVGGLEHCCDLFDWRPLRARARLKTKCSWSVALTTVFARPHVCGN